MKLNMHLVNIIKFITIKSILLLSFFIFTIPINGLYLFIKLIISKLILSSPKTSQFKFSTVLINSGNTNITLCLTRILGISGYNVIICDKNKYCICKFSKYCSIYNQIHDNNDDKTYLNNVIKKYNIEFFIDFTNESNIYGIKNIKYCTLFQIKNNIEMISELKKIGLNLSNHEQYIQSCSNNYYSFSENIYNIFNKNWYSQLKKIIVDWMYKEEKYFNVNDIKPFIAHSHITPIYNIMNAINNNVKWKTYDFHNNCLIIK